MERSNLIFAFVLLLIGSKLGEVRAKCTLTPPQGEVRIAYVCVDGDFDEVAEVPSEAEWIEFTLSRINYLPPDAFSRFHKLRRLTFYNCNIKRVSPDAFRGLDTLEWLLMSNTKIGVAKASVFRHLTNLRNLALDGAGLEYVEPEVFHSFLGLEKLSLMDNDLDCLPIDALGRLSNLRTVQIGRNPWLCDCRGSIGKFMDDRNIDYGPEDRRVTDFRDGSVSYSKRVYQCMVVLNHTALPAPEASFEEIERQNEGRYEWRETVVTGISDLDKLPDDISWMQVFDVDVPTVRRYAFFRFGNTLRSIELSNCGIRHIEREAFAGLHKLERLTLTGNRLITLKHEWFRDLTRLSDLVLRRNAISLIEHNALVHLRSLKRLDLRDNRLGCLNVDFLRGPDALERLEAAGNPWNCECRRKLQEYLERLRIGYAIDSGRCDQEIPTDREDDQSFHRNSTTSGKIRWCWAYQKPTWTAPSPPTTPMTTTPRMIERTTPSRPGDCYVSRTSPRTCICSRATLEDLENVPDNIETIVFSSSTITTIPDYAFRKFGRHLRKLEFRGCNIHTIESRAFYDLRYLDTLVISGNDLTEVRYEWFEYMRHLTSLDLRGNGITRIPFEVFQRLPNLVRLDVSNNNMRCIDIKSLEELERLETLELENNPWSCLCAKKLVELMNSRRIDCKCNPDELVIKADGCNDDFSSTVRPDRPTMMTPRPTTTTDYPIIPLPTPLPQSANGTCYQNPQDDWYHCSNGDLSILSKIPGYATKIEIVDSYIPNLPPMAFNRFSNLTELVIRNCTLTNVDRRAFDGLDNLVKLTLRENHLKIVKHEWFRHTRRLGFLDLSDNRFTEIESGSLDHLKELEYLNLEGNAFECIFTNLFLDLPKLRNVEFGRNPLKSRCRPELRQFLECRGIKYTDYSCRKKCNSLGSNIPGDEAHPENFTSDAASISSASAVFATLIVGFATRCI